MLKILLKKISIYLSFYYVKRIRYNKRKHFIISSFLKKKINIFFKKNPRLSTHINLSNEITKIINENKLNFFLRNTFVQNIFFIHNRFFISHELSDLKNDKNWKLWKKLLEENDIGNPVRFFLYSKSSGNRIRQVYFLKKFLEQTKNNDFNSIKNIVELGGGYGCMAQIFKRLNKKINYQIYDMYEVNLLQYYYLKMNNCNPNLISYNKGINLINKISKLKSITKKYKTDLFIANWSLSEFPLNFRKKFLPFIKNSKYSIISFQENFENVNNVKFFKSLIIKLKYKFNYKIIGLEHYNKSLFNKSKHFMLILIQK